MKSLRNQINHCYGYNAHAKLQVPLHLTSFTGPVKESVTKLTGFTNWNIATHEEHYLDCFPKESIVYLTSDSPNVLETLNKDDVYIIGGMVDHNRLKVLPSFFIILSSLTFLHPGNNVCRCTKERTSNRSASDKEVLRFNSERCSRHKSWFHYFPSFSSPSFKYPLFLLLLS